MNCVLRLGLRRFRDCAPQVSQSDAQRVRLLRGRWFRVCLNSRLRFILCPRRLRGRLQVLKRASCDRRNQRKSRLSAPPRGRDWRPFPRKPRTSSGRFWIQAVNIFGFFRQRLDCPKKAFQNMNFKLNRIASSCAYERTDARMTN